MNNKYKEQITQIVTNLCVCGLSIFLVIKLILCPFSIFMKIAILFLFLIFLQLLRMLYYSLRICTGLVSGIIDQQDKEYEQ